MRALKLFRIPVFWVRTPALCQCELDVAAVVQDHCLRFFQEQSCNARVRPRELLCAGPVFPVAGVVASVPLGCASRVLVMRKRATAFSCVREVTGVSDPDKS